RRPGRRRRKAGATRGVAWMLLAGLGFSLMVATVKWLGDHLHPFQITFFRCLIGLMVILPFVLRSRGRVLRTRHLGMHLSRGLIGVSAMIAGFYAVTRLPLADVTAVSFTKAMFIIVLAVLFVGERVRWRRWTATAVGFAAARWHPGTNIGRGLIGFNPTRAVICRVFATQPAIFAAPSRGLARIWATRRSAQLWRLEFSMNPQCPPQRWISISRQSGFSISRRSLTGITGSSAAARIVDGQRNPASRSRAIE
ncbi:MAG: DMT family transporter, partial [Acidobacteria bacterium]|nr:DMT family transporter [Acidobacteriota bacterium]